LVVNRTAPVVALALLCLGAAGCARQEIALGARAPSEVETLTQGAQLTVIEFFSSHCPCQSAHDARLLALHARFAERGVRFVPIDSEATATPDADRSEAAARHYPFPIVSDPDGKLADALGASWATFTVVIDGAGRVRYRGGIDSDKSHLTDDAEPWLENAIDSLLSGRDPALSETKALGCALQRK
jgi:hypothetical protein